MASASSSSEGSSPVACSISRIISRTFKPLLRLFDREMNRTTLGGDGVNHGLANPPDGIGDKADAALGIEPLGGFDESNVALMNQIRHADARNPYSGWRRSPHTAGWNG